MTDMQWPTTVDGETQSGPDQSFEQVLVVSVGSRRCALPVGCIVHVTLAAAVEPLPGAPEGVLGVVDVHGAVLPVLDLRQAIGEPPVPLSPCQCFLIVESGGRRVACVVDAVHGVVRVGETAMGLMAAANGQVVLGTVRHDEGLLLLCGPAGIVAACDRVLASLGGGACHADD